jgi:hypothetical protein
LVSRAFSLANSGVFSGSDRASKTKAVSQAIAFARSTRISLPRPLPTRSCGKPSANSLSTSCSVLPVSRISAALVM